jgi:glycogen phosphorylase
MIFTTHTAVAAGHDHFANEKMDRYFHRYCAELNLPREQLLALGRTPKTNDFNMTALAARGSRFMNGVSRIHGDVSALILSDLWPEVPEQENPITYVTNGVHAPSFLAPEMADIFDRFIGSGWNQRLHQPGSLDDVMKIPDHVFWSTKQHLKSRLLNLIRRRVSGQNTRNQGSEAHVDRVLKYADPDNPNVLTFGFARRFATYKRATLLFENLEWLREIVNDEERPVLFIFAGKAHPADEPGKEFMRRIVQFSQQPEFEGKFLLVEGYDLRLARRLVAGVDVWLNNPIFPLEASGTSGMKAGFNGTINLSVLDGWWGEGYTGDNGWAIKPASEKLSDERRNMEEARSLYELLQDKVIPLYYQRGEAGFSPEWIQMAKRSIMTLLPVYNSERMVGEYLERFYIQGAQRGHDFVRDNYAAAKDLAAWKKRVRSAWHGVQLRQKALPQRLTSFGDRVSFSMGVSLVAPMKPEDIVVELLLTSSVRELPSARTPMGYKFTYTGERGESGEWLFKLDLAPELCGKLEYRIRAYPYHPMLTHRFEMGLMKWI